MASLKSMFDLGKDQDENPSSKDVANKMDKVGEHFGKVRAEMGKAIFGQDQAVENCLISMLCGGHALLVGVPGLAKTRLVDSLAKVLGLGTKRIQCTPDLMPSDILGSEILEDGKDGKRNFRFIKGPVFTELLMADEINRASPRTQSALLQAMQEKVVSVAGEDRKLPTPFHVIATQNPIEQEGTYPLPEAQLDRFVMEITMTYPSKDAEKEMVLKTTGSLDAKVSKIFDSSSLLQAQALVRAMPIGERVVNAILTIVRNGRPELSDDKMLSQALAWGPGPRASQALALAVRARALLSGRLAPSMDDLLSVIHPVLQHRMALTFSARADGISKANVIDALSADFR